MDKEYILQEIRRTAQANGGTALGRTRFEQATGIRYYDWYGRHWARWEDAVREAGVEPSRMNEAFDDEYVLRHLALLTRGLGRVPVQGDLLMARRNDPEFPSEKVFLRFGSKAQRAARILAYCEANAGFDDVVAIWQQVPIAEKAVAVGEVEGTPTNVGFVY
jgi:hypothetical protein